MTTLQPVTVRLPQAIYRRLEQTATITKRSLDDVLLQTIRGNIPPSLEDVPPEMQDALTLLLNLSDNDLWAVANSPIDPGQWQRHRHLLQKNADATLGEQEQRELEHLRTQADRYVLRRSFALALLKWRGYALPSHDDQAENASP